MNKTGIFFSGIAVGIMIAGILGLLLVKNPYPTKAKMPSPNDVNSLSVSENSAINLAYKKALAEKQA